MLPANAYKHTSILIVIGFFFLLNELPYKDVDPHMTDYLVQGK